MKAGFISLFRAKGAMINRAYIKYLNDQATEQILEANARLYVLPVVREGGLHAHERFLRTAQDEQCHEFVLFPPFIYYYVAI